MEDSPIGDQAQDDGPESQRRDERDSLLMLARIRLEGHGDYQSVRVRNVSSGGLMAQASDEYRPGMHVDVELDGIGRIGGSVAWAEAGRIGIAFDHPVDKVRARKPVVAKDSPELFQPGKPDTRRPSLRPR